MRDVEILAPGGDIDSIKAAIKAGADAIYLGLSRFNARNRAENIGFDNLQGIIPLAHQYQCKVFLTLNIVFIDSEFPALFSLLNKLVNTRIDGVIVQDLGLFYLLQRCFKSLEVHASTQTTTHNAGQIQFLKALGVNRVNLSRELNFQEISMLTQVAHNNKVSVEVFVHGSYCLSFSGLCYMSSVHGGNSGNRGRCSQPCRNQYQTTDMGYNFPLNLKDNSAYLDVIALIDSGVDSLKIEGRIKKFHYVYWVVKAWRKLLDNYNQNKVLPKTNSTLYKVFNRDFTNGFLKGELGKNLFIDNPRDNSALYVAKNKGEVTNEGIEFAKQEVYNERTEIINNVRAKIDTLSVEKAFLNIHISGKINEPLKVLVQTPDAKLEVCSRLKLSNKGSEALSYAVLMKRFKAFDETAFLLKNLNVQKLDANVYIPYKELTYIKNEILFFLNGSKALIPPVSLPLLKRVKAPAAKAKLSVLIANIHDAERLNGVDADLYFQLPSDLNTGFNDLIEMFQGDSPLIPWFPAILMQDSFIKAAEFLKKVKPQLIITNNTGIALEANKLGIKWIAGPYMNLTNSYGLLSLKENFACAGAFISNEMNKTQIKQLKKPNDFDLYYSIYHPIQLMTSRQCLFQQVIGCYKTIMDDACLSSCAKKASITGINKQTFVLEKSQGNFCSVYNNMNFLNTDVVEDLLSLFTSLCIDLRAVNTKTSVDMSKAELVRLFSSYLKGDISAKEQINQGVLHTTNHQYCNKRGI